MSNYMKDITLNEKDSLQDMLSLEKSLLKLYATALTEGTTKPFREAVKSHLSEVAEDQMQIFFLMTELSYYTVESAEKTELSKQKEKFCALKKELS